MQWQGGHEGWGGDIRVLPFSGDIDPGVIEDKNLQGKNQAGFEEKPYGQTEAEAWLESKIGTDKPPTPSDIIKSVKLDDAPQMYTPEEKYWQSPYAQKWRDLTDQGLAEVAGRDVRLDTAPQAEWRERQGEIADMYAARMRGEAPSVAEQQFQRSQEANIRAAQAAAASTRGRMAGGTAQRILQDRMGQMNLEGAQQAAQLRADEQARAEQMYAGLVQGARGQDLSMAGEEANILLNQQQIRDNMTRYYMSQGYSIDAAEQASLRDYQTMLSDQVYRNEAMRRNYAAQQAASDSQETAAIIGGIASLGAAGLSAYGMTRGKG